MIISQQPRRETIRSEIIGLLLDNKNQKSQLDRIKFQEELSTNSVVSKIKFYEKGHKNKEATKTVFNFIFGQLDSNKFDLIDELISNPLVFSLTAKNLIAIINLCFNYRDVLDNYKIFFDKSKDICRKTMEQKDFEVTFRKFGTFNG